MCGIAGVWCPEGAPPPELQAWAEAMATALTHRGPDDAGTWLDAPAGLALGFRRLAIVDLSPAGHQPMVSANGRYVIVFNGEVYNFAALRHDLLSLGYQFRGHSDTEVLLAAIEAWGLVAAVTRFVGMFAIALWDRAARTLHLIRDRVGIKPLYYGWVGDTLLFGSELKALRTYPHFTAAIDRDALALFLRHNYVPAPYSIYQGIRKLPPGTILTVPVATARTSAPVPYWSARAVAEAGVARPFAGSDAEAIAHLDRLLREAVALRMVADVPLGAFLSGGIDSSTVVALMQAQSPRPVKTFSIGFHQAEYNEATHAAAVARRLGTDHTELYVTPAEAQAVIPRLPWCYDEPFADSSQIPTLLVSQLARQQVTVSLSGDGGDELFGGYNRYFWGRSIWRAIGRVPAPARKAGARALTSLAPARWDREFQRFSPVLPRALRQRMPGDKLHKLAGVLAVDTFDELYWRLVSHWQEPATVVLGAHEPPTVLRDRRQHAAVPDFVQQMMYLDLMTYLPDDILTKVDRASMAVSLEARVPLLDHRVVEFAWTVPLGLKIRAGQGKWLLRQVLHQYVPPALLERPKMGFGVPIDTWLRGPLRAWAENLLDERRLREEGFFCPAPIRQQWAEHLTGARNWQYHLWDVLMFQAWYAYAGARR